MAELSFTAANLVASAQAQRRTDFAAGAAVARGDLVYLNTSNRWVQTDANAAATGNGIADLVGIVESDGAAGQRISVVIFDPAMVAGATLVKGTVYVAGATAGKVNPITDLTTGWYRRVVAVAVSTTVWYFNPNGMVSGATD